MSYVEMLIATEYWWAKSLRNRKWPQQSSNRKRQ